MHFKHRTFNSTDLLYFIEFLKYHYSKHDSLEEAFIINLAGAPTFRNTRSEVPVDMETGLAGFYDYFFSLPDIPNRTRKHISTPEKKSSCKRLNMYLRWMVRRDKKGVDFGIWKRISPAQLICPLDVHVSRVARRMGMLQRNQTDWQAALELTEYLRTLDSKDPVKYDFALFGTGITENKTRANR